MVGFFLSFFDSSLSCFSFLFALFALPHFVATIPTLKKICKASSPFLVFFGEFLKVQASSLVQSSSQFKFTSTRLSIRVQNSSSPQLDSQFWFKGRDWEFFMFTMSSKISTQAPLFKREKTLKSSQALFSSLFCNK